MCKDHISFEEALATVKARRSQANPNPGFCEQLKILETECDRNIEHYTHAPDLAPAERAIRDRQWLAQRKAALSGTPHGKPSPWCARRSTPAWPPAEGEV